MPKLQVDALLKVSEALGEMQLRINALEATRWAEIQIALSLANAAVTEYGNLLQSGADPV
jgi:hypothetical protein